MLSFIVYASDRMKLIQPIQENISGKIISNLAISKDFIVIIVRNANNFFLQYIKLNIKKDINPEIENILNIKIPVSVDCKKFYIASIHLFTILINNIGQILIHNNDDIHILETKIQIPCQLPCIYNIAPDIYHNYILYNRGVLELISYNIKRKEIKDHLFIHQETIGFHTYYNIPITVIPYRKQDDFYLLIPSYNGRLTMYKNQKELWKKILNLSAAVQIKLVIYKEKEYIIAYYDTGITTYDLDGNILWSKNIFHTDIGHREDNIYIYTKNHYIYIYDINNGILLKKININAILKKQKTTIKSLYYFFVTKEKIILFANNGIYISNDLIEFHKLNIVITNKMITPVQGLEENDFVYFTIYNNLYKIL
jgi:hypothetical protein